MSSEIDMNGLLAQMRALAAQAEGRAPEAAGAGADGPGFAELLRRSIDSVSEAQKEAGRLAAAFETGDPNVNLAEVMVALQKANLSFQAMTQVRNKLVAAYQEIMGMQI